MTPPCHEDPGCLGSSSPNASSLNATSTDTPPITLPGYAPFQSPACPDGVAFVPHIHGPCTAMAVLGAWFSKDTVHWPVMPHSHERDLKAKQQTLAQILGTHLSNAHHPQVRPLFLVERGADIWAHTGLIPLCTGDRGYILFSSTVIGADGSRPANVVVFDTIQAHNTALHMGAGSFHIAQAGAFWHIRDALQEAKARKPWNLAKPAFWSPWMRSMPDTPPLFGALSCAARALLANPPMGTLDAPHSGHLAPWLRKPPFTSLFNLRLDAVRDAMGALCAPLLPPRKEGVLNIYGRSLRPGGTCGPLHIQLAQGGENHTCTHPGLHAILTLLIEDARIPLHEQVSFDPTAAPSQSDIGQSIFLFGAPLPHIPAVSSHTHLAQLARWRAIAAGQPHGLPHPSWIGSTA